MKHTTQDSWATWLKRHFRSRNSELLDIIEAFETRLRSGMVISPEDVARCHSARLALNTGRKRVEYRMRSIQTLAEADQPCGIAPAVRELVRYCNHWPELVDEKAVILSCSLAHLIRVCHGSL